MGGGYGLFGRGFDGCGCGCGGFGGWGGWGGWGGCGCEPEVKCITAVRACCIKGGGWGGWC
ncbi:hypothetical protein [Methanosarcina barkeri]|uniref:hypothetical protein n=1 Tax=Methanosarcina barkeri TaxID=2208 RepID=UPI00064F2848|nr:hypothetical protein [Methanosarcina barkeri]